MWHSRWWAWCDNRQLKHSLPMIVDCKGDNSIKTIDVRAYSVPSALPLLNFHLLVLKYFSDPISSSHHNRIIPFRQHRQSTTIISNDSDSKSSRLHSPGASIVSQHLFMFSQVHTRKLINIVTSRFMII